MLFVTSIINDHFFIIVTVVLSLPNDTYKTQKSRSSYVSSYNKLGYIYGDWAGSRL